MSFKTLSTQTSPLSARRKKAMSKSVVNGTDKHCFGLFNRLENCFAGVSAACRLAFFWSFFLPSKSLSGFDLSTAALQVKVPVMQVG